MTTHLLIDADLAAYRAASACQNTYDWGDGTTSVTSDLEAAKKTMRDFLDGLMSRLFADKLTICLSDDFRSFRKEMVDPTYKGNRKDIERPQELYPLKSWLEETYPSARRPLLEADDVMGIMATEPGHGEERIIVSQDKDMRTIPGLLYRPYEDAPCVEEISLEDADFYHLYQTLAGDAVDGYPGCPGVGKITAKQSLSFLKGPYPVHREITRGPRKGTVVTRWESAEMDTHWDVVLAHFARAGLGHADAVKQARLARILRHEDYPNGRIRLWNPGSN